MIEHKPICTVAIPEYTTSQKPNYIVVGKKIDEVIEEHFLGLSVALRYLSLEDHSSKSLNELTKIIQKTGTDRYDPERKMSVAHDFYSEKGVELFAVPVKVTLGFQVSPDTIADFYEGALEDRGYPIRIDVVVVYDLAQLEKIDIKYENGDIGEGDYKFRFPERKADAVLGIIQVF